VLCRLSSTDADYEDCNGVSDSGLLGFGLCPLSGYSKQHQRTQCFGNWICFHPQVKEWETPTLLDPLEIANLNHWGERGPVNEVGVL
jgi:hypothetical protein